MIDYKQIYANDSEYQSIINEFKAAKNELQRKANYGTYKFSALLEEGQAIQNKLAQKIREHRQKRIKEASEMLNHLEKTKKKIGYAEREAEAKELEIRFKLADERELSLLVDSLNTNDLLEISLLRIELKNRGLEDLDKKVRAYVKQNNVDGMDEVERKEYEYRKKMLATYNTMGDQGLIIDGKYTTLDKVGKELWNIAKTTDTE